MNRDEMSGNTPENKHIVTMRVKALESQIFRTPHKNTASNNNVQRELDQRLLEMCNGQLRALGTVVNRLTMSVLIVGIICAGLLLWTLQTTHMRHDALLARIDALEANQTAESQNVIQAAKTTEAYAERASKHIWELKRALKLKFSQERSAAGAQDGEM